jgi:hypothetical protein
LGLPIEGPHQDNRFWIDGLPMQRPYFDFPEVGVRVRLAKAELMSLVGPSTRGCLLGDLFVPVLKRHVEEKCDIGGVG